jgi:hypothetical protein
MEYRFIAGKHRTEDGVDFSFGTSHKVDRTVLYCLYQSTTMFVSFQLMLLFLLISTMLEGWWYILSLLWVSGKVDDIFPFVWSQLQVWWYIPRLVRTSYKLMANFPCVLSQLQVDGAFPVCFESVARLMEYFPFVLSQIQSTFIVYFEVL